MFIQTEPTPNPETVKFLPGQSVAGEQGVYDFPDIESASSSPLAQALFRTSGVRRVFLGSDFISITKDQPAEWRHVKPMVMATIMDHYMAGLPVIDSAAHRAEACGDDTVYEGETAEVVAEIRELIDTRVRPAVAQDGGDIVFHKFDPETGIVHLSMRGACAGCPSSSMTLKAGIENMLKTYIPEVSSVEAVL